MKLKLKTVNFRLNHIERRRVVVGHLRGTLLYLKQSRGEAKTRRKVIFNADLAVTKRVWRELVVTAVYVGKLLAAAGQKRLTVAGVNRNFVDGLINNSKPWRYFAVLTRSRFIGECIEHFDIKTIVAESHNHLQVVGEL